jgi:hypothetical protein
MMQESGAPTGPVRIELATSELEGGRFRAWADPARVLTVVAVSTPSDTFARMVEPRLSEPDSSDPGHEDSGGGPPALRSLLGKLRDVHARLWRENRSLMREARGVEVSCALAEEDRVYFVKGAPAWICLLRNGQAHPVGRPPEQGAASGAALGRTERLGLEVTSLAVRPGDTLAVFASESDQPPDLRAVENLFHHTPDLKRACDGLVNLLGLQAQGACAVALRFVPVAAGPGGPRPNPLDDLADAWDVGGGEDAKLGAPAPSAVRGRSRVPVPTADATKSAPAAPASTVPGGALPPATVPRPAAESVDPDFPGLDEMLAALDRPGAEEADTASLSERAEPAPAEPVLVPSGLSSDEDELPHSRPHRTAWIALLAAVVVTMVALVALPRSTGRGVRVGDWIEQAWRGGGGTGATGALMVAPEPPARAVLVDGRAMAGETPVRIDSVAVGRRRVTLDLGPCGVWEEECTVRVGEALQVAPRLVGSVSVLASDAAAGGRAWIQGRPKAPVPAVFDSLPAGWIRVFYEDDRIPMWDRMVLVKPGKASRLLVPNENRGGQGAIRVEALRMQGREGLVESEGDTVRVDGEMLGATPLDAPLAPGLHSVRVGSVGAGAYSTVLEVKAGGVRSVLARLGEGELPVIHHVAPGRVLVRGPILLTVTVSGPADEWASPTLHAPDLTPGLREIPMQPVEGNDGMFVGMLNAESVPLGRELRYYFTMDGPEGRSTWSDVFKLQPEAQWAGAGTGQQRSSVRTQPSVERVGEPAVEPTAEPATEPVAKPAVEPATPTDEDLTP